MNTSVSVAQLIGSGVGILPGQPGCRAQTLPPCALPKSQCPGPPGGRATLGRWSQAWIQAVTLPHLTHSLSWYL